MKISIGSWSMVWTIVLFILDAVGVTSYTTLQICIPLIAMFLLAFMVALIKRILPKK